MLDKLLKRLHVHSWQGSAWNRYYNEVEQRCKCGARRHHMLEDITGEYPGTVNWREGAHPIAADMREKGIARNY